uniref:DNA polymerase n=1 Tax=Parastrongyloides trichosuri TaxID=131310 RepID=A0A0N4Z9G7_PARTI
MDKPCMYTKIELNSDVNQKVPVIRMYGISEEGYKCVANIHGVLPYFIINIGDISEDLAKINIKDTIKIILLSLENKWIHSKEVNDHIFEIKFFESKSIYGYYDTLQTYAKIYFYNPSVCSFMFRAIQKMSNWDFNFQPYNGTMPYITRFFVDYNIFGMDYVKFENVYYRPHNDCNFEVGGKRCLEDKFIIPINKLSNIRRNAFQGVEFDVIAKNIINRRDFFTNTRNPGIEAIWKEEEERCKMNGISMPKEKTYEHVKSLSLEKEIIDLDNFSSIIRKLKKVERSGRNSTFLNTTCLDSTILNDNDVLNEVISKIDDITNKAVELDESFDSDNEEEKINFEEMFEVGNDEEDEDEFTEDEDDPEFDEDELLENINNSYKDQMISNNIDTILFNDNFNTQNYSISGKEIYSKMDVFKQGIVVSKSGDLRFQINHVENSFSDLTFLNETVKEKTKNGMLRVKKEENKSTDFKNDCNKFMIKNLSTLSMELISSSSSKKYFDPEFDKIIAISICFYNDSCVNGISPDIDICFVDKNVFKNINHDFDLSYLKLCEGEEDIIMNVINIVYNLNPDFIIGYEIYRESWGYLIQRCQKEYQSMILKLSRVHTFVDYNFSNNLSKLTFPEGRVTLNIWKIVKRNVNLRSYDFFTTVHSLLSEKIQKIPIEIMSSLLDENQHVSIKLQIIKNLHKRCSFNMKILNHMGTLITTSEMAKVYGIQFEEALTRGSQFRVESMLYRECLKQNYVGPSVSVENRIKMPSPEVFPLVVEPQGAIYRDSILVLDFQSLYPSMCMAYNYCFSTCLSKVKEWGKYVDYFVENPDSTINLLELELGAITYRPVLSDILKISNIKSKCHISPMGTIFVKKDVRKGVIPTLLEELLSTRQMIKAIMKKYKNDEHLYKILDARQLALKLLANVTYGYTAANFSGKMPCYNLADAIVSSGRKTLERCIYTIQEKCKDLWHKLEVVYGDTDSVFVRVHGKCSMEESFKIGNEIAYRVTKENPPPVVLKFEKVMKPCVLLTKKRYVGYSYESLDQTKPIFDAKGIETVRRDNCPLISNEVENFLKILFENSMNTALYYIKNRLQRIEQIPFNKFIISASFRGEYAERAVVPSKKIMLNRAEIHERYVPLIGSRIQYVVKEPNLIDSIDNKKNLTIIANVVEPDEFLNNKTMKLNYAYYINNLLLPALNRITKLEEIDIIAELPSFKREICNICIDDEDEEENEMEKEDENNDGSLSDLTCDYVERDCILNLYQKYTASKKQKIRALNSCISCIGDIEQCNTRCENLSCDTKQLHIVVDEDLRGNTNGIIQINKNGLIFFAKNGMEIINDLMINTKFHSYTGIGPKRLSYHFVKIEMVKFKLTNEPINLSLFGPKRVTATFGHLDLKILVDYKLKYKHDSIVHEEGQFEVNIHNGTACLGIDVASKSFNHIQSSICNMNIGKIEIVEMKKKVEAWIRNEFEYAVEHFIKSNIITSFCETFEHLIEEDVKNEIHKIKLPTELDEEKNGTLSGFYMTYQFPSTPIVDNEYGIKIPTLIAMYFNKSNKNALLPTYRPKEFHSENHMCLDLDLMTFSQKYIETIYTSPLIKILGFEKILYKLHSKTRDFFSCGCETILCISDIVPDIKRYCDKHMPIILQFNSFKLTNISTLNEAISINSSQIVTFELENDNKSKVVLFELEVYPEFILNDRNIKIEENKLSGSIEIKECHFKILSAPGIDMNENEINKIIELGLKDYIKKFVNVYLLRGIPLPSIDGYEITNYKIGFTNTSMPICYDLKTKKNHVKINSDV